MLSLRGGELHLLNLRGGLRVRGRPMRDVRLGLGLKLEVAPGLFLEVVDVRLPQQVLAVKGPGVDVVLEGACSLVLHPTPQVVSSQVENAAHFWQDGRVWYVEHGEDQQVVVPGQPLQLGEWEGIAELRSLADASMKSTQNQARSVVVHTCFDTAQVFCGGRLVAAFSGIKGRLLHELAEVDGPVAWSVVAREVWSNEATEFELRRRWDKTMSRIRVMLRDAGVRDDLVKATGTGQVELLLYPGDEIQCRD